jgi:hypothetical protein
MTEVFVHADFTRVGHCKAILEEAGIPCFVRNENTQNLLAGLPDPMCHPALCVTNDSDAERALDLLRDFREAELTTAPDWKCPQCGESVPGNFDSCWKCETPRPGAQA